MFVEYIGKTYIGRVSEEEGMIEVYSPTRSFWFEG